MKIIRKLLLASLIVVLPLAVPAQDEEKGKLTQFLEDNLSGAGRTVTVTGFSGAFSSEAKMDALTIADDEGVWLTLKGVTLDWSRLALLTGKVKINTLSADDVIVERAPKSETPATPPAAAQGFSLPELPVSINVGTLEARHFRLGAALLGQEIEGALTASANLADGEGEAKVNIQRAGAGPAGQIAFDGSYVNATGVIAIDLDVNEGPGGIAATLIGLPGKPAVALTVKGGGPVSDFKADIALRTDDADRLAGAVILKRQTDGGQGFDVDLSGDMAPLFVPQYAEFFGNSVKIKAAGARSASGLLNLTDLDIATRALTLKGSADVGADGIPTRIALDGALKAPEGDRPVLLPIGGAVETRLAQADLSLAFDSAKGDGWTGNVTVLGLDRADVKLERAVLAASGTIRRGVEAAGGPELTADVTMKAAGLALTDPDLQKAIGAQIDGKAALDWQPKGAGFRIQSLTVDGADYGLKTSGQIGDLTSGLKLTGDLEARYADLSRLSGIAKRPLSGAVTLTARGTGSPLGGDFDAKADIAATDVTTGIAQADGLLKGTARVTLDATRDGTGTMLRGFTLDARTLSISATGTAASGGSDLTAKLRFADLGVLGPDYAGSLDADATLSGTLEAGRMTLKGTGQNLEVGDPRTKGLLKGTSDLDFTVAFQDGRYGIEQGRIANPQVSVSATGYYDPKGSDLKANVSLPDLAVAGPGYGGSLRADAAFSGTPEAGHLVVDGTGQNLAVGDPRLSGLLRGGSTLGVDVTFANGRYEVKRGELTTAQVQARANGVYDPAGSDITATFNLPNLSVMGPGYRGSLRADAALKGSPQSGSLVAKGVGTDVAIGQRSVDGILKGQSILDVDVAFDKGRYDIRTATLGNAQIDATVLGYYDPKGSDLSATVSLPDLSVAGPGYKGSIKAEAKASGTVEDGRMVLNAETRNLAVGQDYANRILAGSSTLATTVNVRNKRIEVESLTLDNPQLKARASGSVEGDKRNLTLDARLANLGLLVPGFPGAVTLSGTVNEDAKGFGVDMAAKGPGGIDTTVKGTLAPDFSAANLKIAGSAQAGLANAFLGNRQVSGLLRFDLGLNGPLGLSALSGKVTLSDGRLSDPSLPFSLTGLRGTVGLDNSTARLDLNSGFSEGGALSVTGTIGLTGSYDGNLTVALNGAVIKDPLLYQTLLNGQVTVNGPLTGGAMIAGRINVGETEVRVPSTGLGGGGALPDLRHVNESAPVRATRKRAGLLDDGSKDGGGGGGRPYGLNLVIDAPARIFIRGRGLDVELGGRVTIQGTTNNIVPSGGLDLIRGRLDILGKRLDITTAQIQLQGDFVPYLNIVASSTTDGVTASVTLSGRADDPAVTFSSNPELPQEEVLARLLFGRGIDKISALQAAQLASSVATLAGRGGDGIIGNLRKATGFDDLDFTTDANGNSAVKAGKYLSKNVYSEVEVGQNGQSKINLNLDIRKGLKLKGSVGQTGAGIGIYYEKDY